MKNDDPRLSALIKTGKEGDVVIVGAPFDYSRKRTINKGGEDNAPCCLRRFFHKVGTLTNPEKNISIKELKVSDYGNISLQAQNQVVAPERAISRIAEQVYNIISNNQLPFVFGGAKETTFGSAIAMSQQYPDNQHILIAGRPTLKRPFDGSKLTSDNLITLLHFNRKHSLTVLGMSNRYLPQEKSTFHYENISYEQIRAVQVTEQSDVRTQGGKAFKQLLDSQQERNVHVSLSVEAIERFRGCRDLLSYGLTHEEMEEIFLQCGVSSAVKLIDICEFNPSVEDYQSSLLLLNLLYYFLMGYSKRQAHKQ